MPNLMDLCWSRILSLGFGSWSYKLTSVVGSIGRQHGCKILNPLEPPNNTVPFNFMEYYMNPAAAYS
jgi:hypothetical protein